MSSASTFPRRPRPQTLRLPVPAVQAGDEPRFDAERLDCYRVAIEFQALAATLLPRRGYAALRDQLERASVSIPLNIAEAMGRFSSAERAHFFSIARGSATECAAIVDILVSRGVDAGACRHARGLLLRLVQMLTKLNLTLRR
jgi:four helix bundle protein